jgi:hypothetical protein
MTTISRPENRELREDARGGQHGSWELHGAHEVHVLLQRVRSRHHGALEEAEHEHAHHDERDGVVDARAADLEQKAEDEHVDERIDRRRDEGPHLTEVGVLVVRLGLGDRHRLDERAVAPHLPEVGAEMGAHADLLEVVVSYGLLHGSPVEGPLDRRGWCRRGARP